MDRLTVQKKLLTIKKLPIRPQIIQELIQLSQNSKVSMSEYVTVISKDPGLAGEILKVVNSSYYGLKNHISDLKMALSMLGLREIYRIAANSIFYKVFRTIFDKISYDLNLFWTHSQAVANVAHLLAHKHLPDWSAEAYVTGLLHDVGKLLMEQFFNDEWQELMARFEHSEGDGLDLEEEVFGLTHSEIGAILLVRWNIPKEIVIPVRFHHNPLSASSHHDLVNICYFSEKISTALMSDVQQARLREYFIEDKLWVNMRNDFPHLNILKDENLVNELKPKIFKDMQAGI